MFMSREIDIKLCQNYTKSHIYQISYKIRSIKQTIFNKYATNLKTTIAYRSLRISDNSTAVYWSRVSHDNDTVQNLRFSDFSLYPFHFSFTVLLKAIPEGFGTPPPWKNATVFFSSYKKCKILRSFLFIFENLKNVN